ncbi:hypothetical protein SJ05684_c10190 [Sinorhizobium sojae CCBAU 05684]|uniref:Uncharacterized protein n=1 Tax=Sinorhizobium sojae CCBAU 05684 TaxID=716928 RepID=A0A249P9V2_9HYPH|nr:hypothetical protein [Sinorhizobium sojae]ASY62477.1 hypothetical protein SJ05684_c10190 [Sinorhizobium sojae CCBAU 05684]
MVIKDSMEFYRAFLACRYLEESLLLAYAQQEYDPAPSGFGARDAEEKLGELAEKMGFDLVRRETVAAPAKQAAE